MKEAHFQRKQPRETMIVRGLDVVIQAKFVGVRAQIGLDDFFRPFVIDPRIDDVWREHIAL